MLHPRACNPLRLVREYVIADCETSSHCAERKKERIKTFSIDIDAYAQECRCTVGLADNMSQIPSPPLSFRKIRGSTA